MKLEIVPSQRMLIMGKTGGGKTEFAKFYLRRVALYMPVVIVDVKNFWLGEFPQWAGRKEKGTIDRPHLVKAFNPNYWVQIVQPDIYDNALDKLLKEVVRYKYIYVYIDENDGLATATQVPEGIRKVWKQGRAFKVGACDGSQTYSGIPRIFKSQSEKRVLFKVGEEDIEDAAHLVHVTPEDVMDLDPYEWIYYDTETMEHGIWMPPIDLDKERRLLAA